MTPCRTRQFITGSFLTSAGVAFAASSIYSEVRTGEPALRGLVHAGIAGLFVFVLYARSDHASATLFAAFGMAIGAGAAWAADRTALACVLAAAGVEALRLADNVPAIGACLALSMARSSPTSSCVTTETMTFVFHAAFASSVVDPTGAVQAIVCATLALGGYEPSVAPLLWWACARAAVCSAGWPRSPSTDDDSASALVLDRVAGGPTHVGATIVYVAALSADAWLCCSLDPVATSTRALHVAAVGASLLYLVPAACDASAWLKWPLTAFPVLDVGLCAYRLARMGPSHPTTLYVRALGALSVALALHTPTVRVQSPLAAPPRTKRSVALDRAALVVYVVAHAAQALQSTSVEDALATLFHYVVIVFSFAWMGIEDMDWLSLRYARVFLVAEGATSALLLVLVSEQRVWTATSAVCAAFLASRVHAERERATMRYESSLLSIVDRRAEPTRPALEPNAELV